MIVGVGIFEEVGDPFAKRPILFSFYEYVRVRFIGSMEIE